MSLISTIKNGIVAATSISRDVSNFLSYTSRASEALGRGSIDPINSQDGRPTSSTNPRAGSVDPTSLIDAVDSTNILSFPPDRPRYYMSFAFEEYRRPSQFDGLTSNGLTDYIALPLPNNLRDNNYFTWNEQESNVVAEVLSQAAGDVMDKYLIGGVSPLDSLKDPSLLTKGGQGITGAAIGYGVSTAANMPLIGPVVRAGMQMAGVADNKFMTMTFGGPNFKEHQFMWRLNPRNAAESATLRKIRDTFKKAAHPEILTSSIGGFWKYPMIVWPKLNPKEAAKQMYAFKPCVITSWNVNFTPNDRPGFHYDDSPIEVVIELGLKEIELWRGGNGGVDGQLSTIKNGDFNDIDSPPVPNKTNIKDFVKDLGVPI
jgi:hypothetical protein